MKNKTISISEEIAEKLKREDNASGLINSLLIQHYKSLDIKTWSATQKKERLEQIEKQLELEKQKIIEDANKKIKELEA